VRSINVLLRDKTARRIKVDEATSLVNAGKATYISHTVFRAIQAGISIDAIRDCRDDKAIKLQIQAIPARPTQKQRRPEVTQDEPQEQRLSKGERRQRRMLAETEN